MSPFASKLQSGQSSKRHAHSGHTQTPNIRQALRFQFCRCPSPNIRQNLWFMKILPRSTFLAKIIAQYRRSYDWCGAKPQSNAPVGPVQLPPPAAPDRIIVFPGGKMFFLDRLLAKHGKISEKAKSEFFPRLRCIQFILAAFCAGFVRRCRSSIFRLFSFGWSILSERGWNNIFKK